jgi:hypothetical protein
MSQNPESAEDPLKVQRDSRSATGIPLTAYRLDVATAPHWPPISRAGFPIRAIVAFKWWRNFTVRFGRSLSATVHD